VRHAQLHNGLVGPSEQWLQEGDAFQTAASDDPDYTIQVSGLQHDSVIQLQRETDGIPLIRETMEVINQMLGPVLNPARGRPSHYALHETTGPVLTARCYPCPDAVYNIDVLTRSISAATYTDATVIDGSEYLQRAIELATASEAAARMVSSERERIKLSPDVAATWKEDQRVLLRHERERKNRLRATSHIPAQVA